MDPNLIIAIIAALVLIVAALWFLQKRRSDQLRSQFGPEYERTVEETGDRRKAEASLVDRERRVKALAIRPLTQDERDRFAALWASLQTEFVDNPEGSIARADGLIGEVMSARGYPVSAFEQVAEDLSVDHPVVVQHYRAAHEVALRHERGEADTEDLRRAMLHYRELYEELVGEPAAVPREHHEEAIR